MDYAFMLCLENNTIRVKMAKFCQAHTYLPRRNYGLTWSSMHEFAAFKATHLYTEVAKGQID